MSPKAAPPPQTLEQKLDQIILHLEKLDKRDRWRTIGGFFRFLINLIPLALLLLGSWYFVNHTSEFIKMMTDQAAKSAATFTKTESTSIFDQLMKQVAPAKK